MLAGHLPRQVDHRKLAQEKARLEGSIPVRELTRLSSMLCDADGDVAVQLTFRRSKKGRPMVTGECHARLSLVCQNCLEPVRLDVTAPIRTTIVADHEALMALDQEEDGVVCADEKIRTVDMIEDDLILALPMVARHPQAVCESREVPAPDAPAPSGAAVIAPTGEAERSTYKPFAGLAQLTKDLKGS